jgi:predicted nicotinamide N-methyase
MEEIKIDGVNDSLNLREFSELGLLEESSLQSLQSKDLDELETMHESCIQICESNILFCHIPKKGLSFQLWPSAVALAHYFSLPYMRDFIGGRKILELGAGTGFLGCYLAKLGGKVLITDLEKTIKMLETTIELNNVGKCSDVKNVGFACATPLDWFIPSSLGDIKSFFIHPNVDLNKGFISSSSSSASFFLDMICACDCIYNPSLHVPLLNTLLSLTGPQFVRSNNI